MLMPIVLASGSTIRAQMLRNAGVEFSVMVPDVDENALKQSMINENTLPCDIADALAAMKAHKVSGKAAGNLVIGCDQVLDFKGQMMSKPTSPDQAFAQLCALRADNHTLFSAAVIYQDQQPVWRHVGQVTLYMRASSDDYLKGYVDRNWDSICHCVGAYLLEAEGVRLFDRIDGDYFTVLGMPLLEILNYLTHQGVIAA
ncbi:MAG: Maf family protein [Rhodobacteraceae bacterium]|nr:Maf family protein [Paracoccaceae bacterium]